MESRFINYPSPHGVHVAETYTSDDHDLYNPPRRNRYSRSVQQTPRIRGTTWISSPEPTPLAPHAPPPPWMPPPQAPSSPYRPASAAPPGPAPTVGEQMVDPYQPQRKCGGLLRSVWSSLKQLTGHQCQPSTYPSRRGSYQSQMMEMPAPLSAGSEGTQYVDPSPTDEQPGVAPYASPYAHPSQPGSPAVPGSRRASPVPSMDMPSPCRSPVPVPSITLSRARKLGETPVVLPSAADALACTLCRLCAAHACRLAIRPAVRTQAQRDARRPPLGAALIIVAWKLKRKTHKCRNKCWRTRSKPAAGGMVVSLLPLITYRTSLGPNILCMTSFNPR